MTQYDYPVIYTVRRFFRNKHKTLSMCNVELDNGRILMDNFCGIELPWKNNKRNISCIPAGEYKAIAVKRYSNRKYALWIQDVPNRSQVMVHTANFVKDLRGCKAPGREFKDIDNDGIIDVTSSQSVMDELQEVIPLGTEIIYKVVDDFDKRLIPVPKFRFSWLGMLGLKDVSL